MTKTTERYLAPELSIYQYQLQFSRRSTSALAKYPGSAWRGALGHALKRTVCIVRNTACAECMLKSSCAYAYIFETPPPADSIKMRKYNASPHPFVLQFDSSSTDPDYYVRLILFGHGQRHLPYLVYAFQRAGLDGIGRSRQVFELDKVEHIDANQQTTLIFDGVRLKTETKESLPAMPQAPDRLKIQFYTPVRIKQQGKNLTPDTFNFPAFFGNLLRRISMLTYFHTDTPLETDFAALTRQARELDFTEKELYWYDWTRYSSRQKTEMQMGGLLGSIAIDISNHPQFWPYLWLGQWTHAGKATSMGMGHYILEAASLPSRTME